jgi:general secretion pathway protein E
MLVVDSRSQISAPELYQSQLLIGDNIGSFLHEAVFNRSWLIRRSIVPSSFSNGFFSLAMANPDDHDAIVAMQFAVGQEAVVHHALRWEIEELIAVLYPDREADVVELDLGAQSLEAIELRIDAPIIRLVQRLLTDAVRRRASDIHIEPMATHVAVRYRIDGALTEVEQLPAALASPVASRIKIMASLDIAESRLPQDGRLRLSVGGRDVDVRVATSPIAHGESIVLRLLGRMAQIASGSGTTRFDYDGLG